jgi:hypothetical protein
MKTWLAFTTSALLFGALAMTRIAVADSSEANCEVSKDGERKNGKSGPCTFGQRQGYIDLDLRNGDTYSLSPGNKANHYRDQKGNKVVRTSSTANSQEFRWENGKYVTVRFNHSGHNSNSGYNPGYGGAGAYGGGGDGGNSADGSYYINPLSNGGFEVVWSKHGCVATFNREREALEYSNSCTNSQTYRSDDIAKRKR